ncbi:MAG: FixH family protein [Cystobacter sp.]
MTPFFLTLLLGSSPSPLPERPPVPAQVAAEAPVASVTSASGRLRVEVLAPAVPLRRGPQRFVVRVSEVAGGQPVQGLTLSVQPWMTSMGHGISESPRVTPLGPGRFEVSGLDLFMPGAWELRLSLTGTGGREQAVVALKLR